MSIAVIPTQANRIRALKEAEPRLTARQIAVRLGCIPSSSTSRSAGATRAG
jgi:hypothetical protein